MATVQRIGAPTTNENPMNDTTDLDAARRLRLTRAELAAETPATMAHTSPAASPTTSRPSQPTDAVQTPYSASNGLRRCPCPECNPEVARCA